MGLLSLTALHSICPSKIGYLIQTLQIQAKKHLALTELLRKEVVEKDRGTPALSSLRQMWESGRCQHS